MTEKKPKKLKDQIKKLENLDRIKTEHLSIVSHELRKPITPIKGYISMMLGGKLGSLSEEQTHALNVLARQSDHMEELVDSLLDVSRLELGKPIPIVKEPLNVKKLVEEAIEGLKMNLESRGLIVKIDIPDNIPEISGDGLKLKRVLSNLIANSIKFTSRGGQITIRAKPVGQSVRLEVVDNGIGIEGKYLQKIFDKFYQIENTQNKAAGGIGMGLAISRQLITIHGGKIWAESAGKNQGSSLIFTLPAVNKGGS